MRHRLRDGLIDRFVEPGQVLQIGAGEGLVVRHPLFDDAGSQGAIFGDHLIDVEAVGQTQSRVDFGGAVA